MNQNSFQKNGMLNLKSGNISNNNQFGRRSLQDIRDDMLNAKTSSMHNNVNHKPENENIVNSDVRVDHRKNVENLQNFYRWK